MASDESTPTGTDEQSGSQPGEQPVTGAPDEQPEQSAEEKAAGSSSPGAWTALTAPGKPDGEVDTRG